MIRHGATPQQVRKFFVAFWKAVLRMSNTAHPPQLRNEVDWARPGHTRVAFDYLYPGRNFPTAGHWHLQPPESSPLPPALHLHLWHHISGVSIYVPNGRMAHPGSGDVLYWFHSRPCLAVHAQRPCFVRQRSVLCYVVDLARAEQPGNSRIVSAGLFCGTGRVHTAFSPGTPTMTAHLHRYVSDNGGTCGVSTSKLLNIKCIRTIRTYDYVCRRVGSHVPYILCCRCKFAFCPCLHIRRTATRLEIAVRKSTRDPQAQRAGTHGTHTAHTEGLQTPIGEQDTPAQRNGRRSLDLPRMYTT